MINHSLLAQIETLSPSERRELIGVVWSSLEPSQLPLTHAERRLLDERLADLQHHPSEVSPWSDVRDRLRKRIA